MQTAGVRAGWAIRAGSFPPRCPLPAGTDDPRRTNMRTTIKIGALAAASALALAACGSSDDNASSGSSGDAAGKTLVVATDLPLQGTAKDSQDSTNNMIKLLLEQQGNKAGAYNIELKTY